MGLSHIPESRKLFTDMSIRENLEMGAYPRRSWKDGAGILWNGSSGFFLVSRSEPVSLREP